MHWLSRIQVVIGIWVLISPWVLGYASFTPALWSNIISGAVIGLLGLWGIFGAEPKKNL